MTKPRKSTAPSYLTIDGEPADTSAVLHRDSLGRYIVAVERDDGIGMVAPMSAEAMAQTGARAVFGRDLEYLAASPNVPKFARRAAALAFAADAYDWSAVRS